MPRSNQPVIVTRQCAGFTTGVFHAGPFKGQRAISADGAQFLPADPFVAHHWREHLRAACVALGVSGSQPEVAQ